MSVETRDRQVSFRLTQEEFEILHAEMGRAKQNVGDFLLTRANIRTPLREKYTAQELREFYKRPCSLCGQVGGHDNMCPKWRHGMPVVKRGQEC